MTRISMSMIPPANNLAVTHDRQFARIYCQNLFAEGWRVYSRDKSDVIPVNEYTNCIRVIRVCLIKDQLSDNFQACRFLRLATSD